MSEISHARYRAGEGEPLVLVHGFTATWRCWMPVVGELVPRFDVIAPTLHGHDGGPQPDRSDHAHSLTHAADHLERLLDDLGVDDAHFAGNSMGGALSLELAKRGRARSVVAISPGGGWNAGGHRRGRPHHHASSSAATAWPRPRSRTCRGSCAAPACGGSRCAT